MPAPTSAHSAASPALAPPHPHPAALTVHHLQIRATATAPLELREHTGASLRGAFFGALWGRFCSNQFVSNCAPCPLVTVCPVSTLVASIRDAAPRGRDIPRPFAIRPPVHHAGVFGPGESFTFGLTLFGCRLELFPYIAIALHAMGQHGIGRRVPENNWERGKFQIDQVQAVNLLTGVTQSIQVAGSPRVQVPDLPMTWADAAARAASLPHERITLRLLTPMRLIDAQKLVHCLHLRPLVQRLIERHDALAREYGGTGIAPETRNAWISAAETIILERDATRWLDLASFSRRQKRTMPIGGLVGEVTYQGDLRPLLPLLVWGTILQAGKDTTKGNGVYVVVA